jgi:radical SAM superfamily enzyme YgiQ (UPF0313 family)/uncharacterized protein YukE
LLQAEGAVMVAQREDAHTSLDDRVQQFLFVNPANPHGTFWSFDTSLDIIGLEAAMAPLGCATAAALLPRSWTPVIHDCNIAALTDAILLSADIVGFTGMLIHKGAVAEGIARARSLGVRSMVGGPIATTCYDQIPGADHYFIGEAEAGGLDRFFADLRAGRAKKAYGHVADEEKAEAIRAYFQGDCDITVGPRPSLANSPVPLFKSLDVFKYGYHAMQSTRGCPFKCEYCDIWPQFGRVPRLKPVDNLLRELDAIHATGYTGSVFIVDDNFIGNKAYVKNKLLPALAQWQRDHGRPYNFFTQTDVRLGDDPALCDAMVDAGFNQVFLGIETPVEASLAGAHKTANIGKNESTLESLTRQVGTIQRSGMQVAAGFIVGFDQDPANIDTIIVNAIERLNIAIAMVGELTALPGTELYERLKREGRLLETSNGDNTHGFGTNFLTTTPNDVLDSLYAHILTQLYPPDMSSYLRRADRMFDVMGPNKMQTRHVGWKEIRALLRVLGRIRPTRQGYEVSRFLTRRLWKDPSSFSEAVATVIFGYHFGRLTEGAIVTRNYSKYIDDRLATLRKHVDAATAAYQGRVDNAKAALHNAQARTHDSIEGMKGAYNDYVKRALEQKKVILADAERRLASVKRDIRDRVRPQYERLVQQAQQLYAPLETTMRR